MNIILDQSEIEAVTGKVRHKAQVRALRALGVEVKVRPDGSPVVSTQHFHEVMGAKSANDDAGVTLNLGALGGQKKA